MSKERIKAGVALKETDGKAERDLERSRVVPRTIKNE